MNKEKLTVIHKCKRFKKLILTVYVNEDGKPTISALEFDGSLSSPIIHFCPFCGTKLEWNQNDMETK